MESNCSMLCVKCVHSVKSELAISSDASLPEVSFKCVPLQKEPCVNASHVFFKLLLFIFQASTWEGTYDPDTERNHVSKYSLTLTF